MEKCPRCCYPLLGQGSALICECPEIRTLEDLEFKGSRVDPRRIFYGKGSGRTPEEENLDYFAFLSFWAGRYMCAIWAANNYQPTPEGVAACRYFNATEEIRKIWRDRAEPWRLHYTEE